MKVMCASLFQDQVDEIHRLISLQIFASTSEAIRVALLFYIMNRDATIYQENHDRPATKVVPTTINVSERLLSAALKNNYPITSASIRVALDMLIAQMPDFSGPVPAKKPGRTLDMRSNQAGWAPGSRPATRRKITIT
jgi:Arc/MetJ-type ribon-helix-helix transcriptional regulator